MKAARTAIKRQESWAFPEAPAEQNVQELLRAAWIVTKPRISMMLVLTGLASMIIAQRGWPGWLPILYFAVAGSMSAGGAAAWNHYLDQDIDRLMMRTQSRPLPQNKVPASWVAVYGTLLVVFGVAAGYLLLSQAVASLLFSGVVAYVVVYTLWLKRRSAWNIVIGGAAGSYMVLAGWYAVEPHLNPMNFVLAAFLFVWTPSHFWPLAIACESDYRRAGVPMLPVTSGRTAALWAVSVNTVLMILLSLAPQWLLDISAWYAPTVALPGLGLLAANIAIGTGGGKQWAYRSFKWSGPYLAWVFLMLIVFTT